MTPQPAIPTPEFSKKSGKGLSDGVVTELFTFWEVRPGHEEDVRAGVRRFNHNLHTAPIEETIKTGLRDSRFVLYDGGKRLIWCTTFESDWDPYIEDALVVVGIDHFLNWLQYTTAFETVQEWARESGGVETLRAGAGSYASNPEIEKKVRASSGGLKQIIMSAQVRAASYFNAIADLTHPEIRKASRLNEAFQRVLDDPAAAEALQHPALKPLLELAAD